ncbi:MAG: DUF2160 family membrane protein [Candidatus Bathyarchaeia archaeon]|nr:hypothetical protein [Candidatus Bathyarchaeota archaeon]
MGFLEKIGLRTSMGDRIFLGIALLILLHLLWMRFLEKYISLWVCFILSVILLVIIVKYG